ncbi:hypothetical protein [Clostridioides sp. ES-S-0001-02]|uniref:hypothetical protein n=1 Tax=Clostridioides sp. ES-S-0001-02 TaxID=2770770 RepID=UPI001D127238|nr:hypothetical protein [Clostridioides sp. ES-S-0001-02]
MKMINQKKSSYILERVEQTIEFNDLFENLKEKQKERIIGILEGLNLGNELLKEKNKIC